jgi:hypothetical protein
MFMLKYVLKRACYVEGINSNGRRVHKLWTLDMGMLKDVITRRINGNCKRVLLTQSK